MRKTERWSDNWIKHTGQWRASDGKLVFRFLCCWFIRCDSPRSGGENVKWAKISCSRRIVNKREAAIFDGLVTGGKMVNWLLRFPMRLLIRLQKRSYAACKASRFWQYWRLYTDAAYGWVVRCTAVCTPSRSHTVCGSLPNDGLCRGLAKGAPAKVYQDSRAALSKTWNWGEI